MKKELFKRGDYVISLTKDVVVLVDHCDDLDLWGIVVDSAGEPVKVGAYLVEVDCESYILHDSNKLPPKLIKNEIVTDLYWKDRKPCDGYILDHLFGKDCCQLIDEMEKAFFDRHSKVRITIEELERIK